MTDDTNLDTSMRAAYRALRVLTADNYAPGGPDDPDVLQIVIELPEMLRLALDRSVAELGAPISWVGPWPEEDGTFVDLQVDFDGDLNSPDVVVHDLDRRVGGEWHQTAFARAARAYKRECGLGL